MWMDSQCDKHCGHIIAAVMMLRETSGSLNLTNNNWIINVVTLRKDKLMCTDNQ